MVELLRELPIDEKIRLLRKDLDPITSAHTKRVSFIVGIMGEYQGLDPRLVQKAKEVALIHDIGKSNNEVQKRIFRPKMMNNSADIAVIKEHVRYGSEMARREGLPELYVKAIAYHHEAGDGNGHPNGWKREETKKMIGEEGMKIMDLLNIGDALDSILNGFSSDKKSRGKAVAEIHRKMDAGILNNDLREAFDRLVKEHDLTDSYSINMVEISSRPQILNPKL